MLDRILTIDFCELVRILLIILPTDMRPAPLSNQIDFFWDTQYTIISTIQCLNKRIIGGFVTYLTTFWILSNKDL